MALAPNKQNLLILKSQKKVLQNGLKLLREKRTGLVTMFLELAQQGKSLEASLKTSWLPVLRRYNQALVFISKEELITSLPALPTTKLSIIRKRVTGVYLENLKLAIKSPIRNDLKANLQSILNSFAKLLPMFLELSQLRLNCLRIAAEIQKTNRQITNLEKRLDDNLSQIKYMTAVLNEKANLEKATLIKIFG